MGSHGAAHSQYQRCMSSYAMSTRPTADVSTSAQTPTVNTMGSMWTSLSDSGYVFLVKVDARYAAVVHLAEELAEVGAPLVPHPCLGEQAAAASGLEYAYAEVDVFAEAHLGEASEAQVDVAAYAHVVGAWVELVELFLASAYSASGEEACHGVAYGLLRVGKRGVRTVGTAEGVGRFAAKLAVNGLKIAFGQDDIGVEHYQVFAL